jgi:hypothetical protein
VTRGATGQGGPCDPCRGPTVPGHRPTLAAWRPCGAGPATRRPPPAARRPPPAARRPPPAARRPPPAARRPPPPRALWRASSAAPGPARPLWAGHQALCNAVNAIALPWGRLQGPGGGQPRRGSSRGDGGSRRRGGRTARARRPGAPPGFQLTCMAVLHHHAPPQGPAGGAALPPGVGPQHLASPRAFCSGLGAPVPLAAEAGAPGSGAGDGCTWCSKLAPPNIHHR